MFIFSEPHPGGVYGCLKPLPDDVKPVIDEMDGKGMSLASACLRIAQALKSRGITGMQIKYHSNEDKTEGWIGLTEGSVQNPPCHSWKLINYSEEKTMTTMLTRNDPVVFHFRIRRFDTGEALPRGGATVVFVPVVARFGVSVCSNKDAFSRKRGREIATGRALSKNSFNPFASEVPATIEGIRGLAKELAYEEATPILGSPATQPWK